MRCGLSSLFQGLYRWNFSMQRLFRGLNWSFFRWLRTEIFENARQCFTKHCRQCVVRILVAMVPYPRVYLRKRFPNIQFEIFTQFAYYKVHNIRPFTTPTINYQMIAKIFDNLNIFQTIWTSQASCFAFYF